MTALSLLCVLSAVGLAAYYAWDANRWELRARKAEAALSAEYQRQAVEGSGYKPSTLGARLQKKTRKARKFEAKVSRAVDQMIREVEGRP